MAKAQRPQITTLTAAQLEALLAQLRPLVPAATYQLIEALLQTLQWIMAAFEQKTISIARLKRMLFGHSTETTAKVFAPHGLFIWSGAWRVSGKGFGDCSGSAPAGPAKKPRGEGPP